MDFEEMTNKIKLILATWMKRSFAFIKIKIIIKK